MNSREHDKRLRLHASGKHDAAIARACGVTREAIRCWRNRNNLPLVSGAGRGRRSFEEEKFRHKLYNEKRFDDDIARRCRMARGSIAQWRKRRGLPAHRGPGGVLGSSTLENTKETERLALYNKGFSDCKIARLLGHHSAAGICAWRKRRGLPANYYGGGAKVRKA